MFVGFVHVNLLGVQACLRFVRTFVGFTPMFVDFLRV